jgi:hypothetical protein
MALSDIDILKALRANKSVQVGSSTIKGQNQDALKKARVVVNTDIKRGFDTAPKPSDFLLRKRENRIVNNATFDERPREIIEQNIPFSKPRSAQEIIEANLGKDFFTKGKSTAAGQASTKKVKATNPSLQLGFFNNFFDALGGIFK